MNQERAYWLAWSRIPGIGPILLKRIHQHFGSLEEAWKNPVKNLIPVEGIGPKMLEEVSSSHDQINPLKLLEEHSKENPNFWTPADEEYPRLLLEIPSPPPVLYYRGQVNPQENQGKIPLIAIVGTREPTEHGKRWTRRLGVVLARHGFPVISGLAMGIDGEAHRSCLQGGGRTIAVLGTGVDVVYPASHRQLYQEVEQRGLILSEYPKGTGPDRRNFPARNRIIAALSRAILVMEAPEKSGALITARYANEFGRDVYTLPNSPDVEQYQGCLRLLRQGAEVIISEKELLEMLGTIPQLDASLQLSLFDQTHPSQPPATPSSPSLPDLEPQLAHVLQFVGQEPTALDSIIQDSGLDASTVTASLLELEFLDLVSQLPGMRYQKC
jgi:DNA processing protein